MFIAAIRRARFRSMASHVPISIPIAAVSVGATLALTGVLRPAIFWNLGKIQLGRRIVGDVGVSVFLICIGFALVTVGILSLWRR